MPLFYGDKDFFRVRFSSSKLAPLAGPAITSPPFIIDIILNINGKNIFVKAF